VVIKRLSAVPIRFGGVENSGWLPANAALPPPTPVEEVVVDFEIKRSSEPPGVPPGVFDAQVMELYAADGLARVQRVPFDNTEKLVFAQTRVHLERCVGRYDTSPIHSRFIVACSHKRNGEPDRGRVVTELKRCTYTVTGQSLEVQWKRHPPMAYRVPDA
jgi:hypothetical protein